MQENKETYYTFSQIFVVISAFISFLKKKLVFIFLFLLIGAGLGFVYSLFQRPKYEAVTTFILEEKSAGGGNLAGLASQMGINLGGITSGGGIFSGDNILDILRSKKIVEQVLLTKSFPDDSSKQTLADRYISYSGLKKKWSEIPALKDISFQNSVNQPLKDSLLNSIYEKIVKKSLFTERVNKQGSIIKVTVVSEDRLFAKLMSDRLVEKAAELYLTIRVGAAQDNIRQLQNRSDSLLALLNNKSFSVAASQLLDVNPGLRTAIVPTEIATRDKTVLTTLYGEVTKNLEANKLILSQQMPVIQLLDTPSLLLEDNKKGKVFLTAAFGFAVAFGYVIFISLGFFIKRLKASEPVINKA
ncbi:MAG: hypothetical protein DI535_16905 [Citrobacter freundii]|nr:MAG: hypothetical protein DI535_16905 [Citrobacter freundii]